MNKIKRPWDGHPPSMWEIFIEPPQGYVEWRDKISRSPPRPLNMEPFMGVMHVIGFIDTMLSLKLEALE